jgi:hypothetical protein
MLSIAAARGLRANACRLEDAQCSPRWNSRERAVRDA